VSPVYNTDSAPNVPVIVPGQRIFLLDTETVTASELTQQAMFSNSDHLPKHYSLEYAFTTSDGVTPANPGVFSVQAVHADTDGADNYVAHGSAVTTGLNAHYIGRQEIVDVVARYMAVVISTTNAVYVTLSVGK
jgi:hypothetical protein